MNIYKRMARRCAMKAIKEMHAMNYHKAVPLLRKAHQWEELELYVNTAIVCALSLATIGFIFLAAKGWLWPM